MAFNINPKDLIPTDRVEFMYPVDIITYYKKQGKSTKSENTRLKIFALAIVTFLIYIIIFRSILSSFGIPWWGSLLIQLILEYLIFRKFINNVILGVSKKRAEQDASDIDDVLRYIDVNLRSPMTMNISGDTANIYEATDGSLVAFMRFRLGDTDDKRSEGTRQVFEDVDLIATKNGFSPKYFVLNELYGETHEYDNFMDTMSGNYLDKSDSRFDGFRSMLLEMGTDIVAETEKSDIPSILLVLKSNRAYTKSYVANILKEMRHKTYKNENSIRYLDFLSKEGVLTAVKQYFGVPLLDLAGANFNGKTVDIIQKYKRFGSVYSVTSTDGDKVYAGRNIFDTRFIPEAKVSLLDEKEEVPYMEDEDFEIFIDD